jgi:hypothetical protein
LPGHVQFLRVPIADVHTMDWRTPRPTMPESYGSSCRNVPVRSSKEHG